MLNQRWLHRRDSYRPAGETIQPRLYEVAEIGASEAKGGCRDAPLFAELTIDALPNCCHTNVNNSATAISNTVAAAVPLRSSKRQHSSPCRIDCKVKIVPIQL